MTSEKLTGLDEFFEIATSGPDPFALIGAMQVAMRNMDERNDGVSDPYGPATLARWYVDAVEAYRNLTAPREGEAA